MNRNTGEIKKMTLDEMHELNTSYFKKALDNAGVKEQTKNPLDMMTKEKPLWFDVGKMLYQGRVIQIDDTLWEVKRADIQTGTPGKVTLKLKYKGTQP